MKLLAYTGSVKERRGKRSPAYGELRSVRGQAGEARAFALANSPNSIGVSKVADNAIVEVRPSVCEGDMLTLAELASGFKNARRLS